MAPGSVEIWDNGVYELLEEKPERPADRPAARPAPGRHLDARPAHLDGKEQNWLLIKQGDDEAPDGAKAHL